MLAAPLEDRLLLHRAGLEVVGVHLLPPLVAARVQQPPYWPGVVVGFAARLPCSWVRERLKGAANGAVILDVSCYKPADHGTGDGFGVKVRGAFRYSRIANDERNRR
jgi:hypothetical protein